MEVAKKIATFCLSCASWASCSSCCWKLYRNVSQRKKNWIKVWDLPRFSFWTFADEIHSFSPLKENKNNKRKTVHHSRATPLISHKSCDCTNLSLSLLFSFFSFFASLLQLNHIFPARVRKWSKVDFRREGEEKKFHLAANNFFIDVQKKGNEKIVMKIVVH